MQLFVDDWSSSYQYFPEYIGSCALREIQQYPSPTEDVDARMRDAESVQPASKSEPDSDYTPKRRGKIRRPRKSIIKKSKKLNSARPFPCPLAGYSCQATFASKNEWKRHVATQHIRLGFWRCELCPNTVDGVTTSYNDFNRKDLFAQHLRRMHFASASRDNPVNDENMADYLGRCYIKLRDPPPKSACLFCSQTFEGAGSWDERMEHVGRHFEKERCVYVDAWRADDGLRDWLCGEGLVERHGGAWQIV